MGYETEQERFWAGEFGSDYVKRNQGDTLLASDLHFFSQALRTTQKITSGIEFGANIGMNLKALKLLPPALTCTPLKSIPMRRANWPKPSLPRISPHAPSSNSCRNGRGT